MFDVILPIDALVAFLGLIVRWAFHADATSTRLKKYNQKFDFTFYLKDNAIMIVLTVAATIALLIVMPEFLASINQPTWWNGMVAFGCGLSNREIVDIIKKRLLDKVSGNKNSNTEHTNESNTESNGDTTNNENR